LSPLFILIFLQLSNTNNVFSQEIGNNQSASGWGGYPVLFYTTRTNVALGAYGMHYFKNEGTPHKSMTSLALVYTLRNQILTQLASQFYWADYRLKTDVNYIKFPDTYYGIGNDTNAEDAEEFSSERIGLELNFQKQIMPNFYLGVDYDFEQHDLIETDPDGSLARGILPGTQGAFNISGVGFSMNYDTRDHVVYCCHGSYFEFYWNIYDSFTGSDYTYMEYFLDLRHYLQITRNGIFAVQGTYTRVAGNAPIQAYPVLGDDRLRGFSARYMDKNMITLQAEYRMGLWDDFGLAFFAGMGDVSDHFQNFNPKEFKFGAGIGFRYMILPANKINLRIDIGFGTYGNSSMTFLPGEAF
jgi:outer membrane protein assembly factor BamA